MTVTVREKVKKQFKNNRKQLRQNWEGYHLLKFANKIRPSKQDTLGRKELDDRLDSNGIGGFIALQKLPSDKAAFTTDKSDGVFESLAEFQDIPTFVCFIYFLEFCRDSEPRRPLDVFDGDDKLFVEVDDGKREIVTLNYAIDNFKEHVKAFEEKLKHESSQASTKQSNSDQPRLTKPKAIEGNKNYYANAVLDVIGRDEQKMRLKAFLDCDLNVAWFQLAGEAGQGKSRLAFDLMHKAPELGYRAGFLRENDINYFKNHWEDWQPDNNYLLIFDYVIGREHEIKPILQTLIYNHDKFQHKIRILLIERQRWNQGSALKIQDQKDQDELRISAHISDKAEWFFKLCEKDDLEGENLKSSRFESGVVELAKLDTDDLAAIVKQLMPGKELPISDDALKKTLKRIDDSGRPLYAYLLAQQLSDSQQGFQSWTKIDLLNYQLVRDRARWKQDFVGKAPTWGDNHPSMKLAVLTTIVRKIRFQDARIKQYFGNVDSSVRREAMAITSGYLIKDDNRPHKINALEPDLLGEWFVLYCFYNDLEFEELLDIAWQYSANETAVFLHRITQDFIDLSKEYKSWDVTEKLLAHKPPHENHYHALANVGVAIAYYLYKRGLVIPQTITVALEHAVKFDINAVHLGFFYRHGIGVARNIEKAIDLYKNAISKGNSDAMTNLGLCYEKGEGVAQDWDEAINLHRSAVELSNSNAMVNLGVCYQKGRGIEKDLEEAIKLYRHAVELNNSNAMANLGLCYQKGEGIKKNLDEAINLYRRAVELGDSQAMVNLGICYAKGEGVEKNLDEAIDLYWRAAELRNSNAMVNLGACYQKGKGVEKNLDKAINLYRHAVELGDSQAMVNLGVCYLIYSGNSQDWDEAINLYRRAVELGDSQAMVNLGFCYQKGRGIERNLDEAIKLYQRAIEAGNKGAVECLQSALLLQNFLGNGYDKNLGIKTWPNIKHPRLAEKPPFDLPVMVGNWKQLTAKKMTAYLDKIITPFEILELADKLDGFIAQYARILPLRFYKDCSLLDIQFYNPSNKNTLIFSAVVNTESAILLNGESGTIHSINPHLLVFDGQKSALDYLQFFCSYIRGDAGPYPIISNSNEIPFKKEVNQDIQNKINEGFFSPRYTEGCFEKEGWQQFEACMLYGDTLFSVVCKVFPNGRVSMEDDNPIASELSILQRRYDGVFRTPLCSLDD